MQITLFLNAQKTKVSGEITNSQTKELLPFVNVQFKGTKIGTTSNDNGFYSIETYYASDTLVISSLGFKQKKIFIKKDKAQQINIELEPSSFLIQEIVIEAKDDINPADVILKNILAYKNINIVKNWMLFNTKFIIKLNLT